MVLGRTLCFAGRAQRISVKTFPKIDETSGRPGGCLFNLQPSTPSMSQQARLPPEVNRILFVRNLPYKISSEELYDVFGKYGAIRQIRIGTSKETRGTAFVVYEDIYDAKQACEHLSGFNLLGRYLIVLYWQPGKVTKRVAVEKQQEELAKLKAQYNLN